MVLDSSSDSVLLLDWVASWKTTEGGLNYWELKPQIKQYQNRIINERLSGYKLYALATTITIPEEIYDDNQLQDQQPTSIISRVFRSGEPEISPDISFYSQHEHPHRDFALSCGIRASFCLPIFQTVDENDYYPDSVLELVSTSDKEIESLRRHFNTDYMKKLYLLAHQLPPKMTSLGLGEMDHVLTVVCEKLTLPLAQCWFPSGRHQGGFRVMYQSSNRVFHNNKLLFNFKDACSQLMWKLSDSLVGKTHSSHKSFFCQDITKISITKYPFAHYARNCESFACFTIFLRSSFPQHRECVLEFFLPSQKMDVHYPHTLLNSIFAIMKEHLHYYTYDSGENLTQVLSVQVVNPSMLNEPESFQIGQPERSHPHFKGLKDEGDLSQQIIRNVLLLFQDGIEEDVSAQNMNLFEGIANDEMPKRTPYIVDEISPLNELEKESPMKCITDTFKIDKQSKKYISYESISEHFGGPLVDAAKSFGVSRSTFKRICRDLGIKRWQNGKRKTEHNTSSNLRRRINDEEPSRGNVSCSEVPPVQDRVVDHTSQDLNKLTVKATYNGTTIRFGLPGSAGFAELEENVIERLHLERNSFSINYQDDEGDQVLIACDMDVRECMEITRFLEKTTIKLLLDPPINQIAP
ncbi:hypothetical protein POM88_001539 [Heracleum sosnowskyi]|uniref:PB1 domain-containing protein n=1 Tax=Heracleum sosnowskyi TaxID=360622 RepID=A0AAD8JD75_9APIA|nr:hypothetical protein POM88_001539 [Heracleum sosnowskyi]